MFTYIKAWTFSLIAILVLPLIGCDNNSKAKSRLTGSSSENSVEGAKAEYFNSQATAGGGAGGGVSAGSGSGGAAGRVCPNLPPNAPPTAQVTCNAPSCGCMVQWQRTCTYHDLDVNNEDNYCDLSGPDLEFSLPKDQLPVAGSKPCPVPSETDNSVPGCSFPVYFVQYSDDETVDSCSSE
jgi:hypothetical protein